MHNLPHRGGRGATPRRGGGGDLQNGSANVVNPPGSASFSEGKLVPRRIPPTLLLLCSVHPCPLVWFFFSLTVYLWHKTRFHGKSFLNTVDKYQTLFEP